MIKCKCVDSLWRTMSHNFSILPPTLVAFCGVLVTYTNKLQEWHTGTLYSHKHNIIRWNVPLQRQCMFRFRRSSFHNSFTWLIFTANLPNRLASLYPTYKQETTATEKPYDHRSCHCRERTQTCKRQREKKAEIKILAIISMCRNRFKACFNTKNYQQDKLG